MPEQYFSAMPEERTSSAAAMVAGRSSRQNCSLGIGEGAARDTLLSSEDVQACEFCRHGWYFEFTS